MCSEPVVLECPVVLRDRVTEAFADRIRLGRLLEVRNQKTKLIAAEAGVKLLRAGARTLLDNEIVRSRLLPQQLRHSLDDAVTYGMAKRVVVPLEFTDVGQAHGAPVTALLERQERLELLDEPGKVDELCFRVAARFLG